MTSQEQKTAQPVDRDIPDTEVIAVSAPSPVFVDSTGRRRRLLRRLSYAFGGLCMLYGGLVSVSLAGGPVSSSAILPLPNLGDGTVGQVHPSPTPQPTLASPKARAIIEALPRDLPAAGNDRLTSPATTPAAPRATSRPATPKPSAPTSRPVESTATPTPSSFPSASDSPAPATSPATGPTGQPPAVPPIPPGTGTGGGSGGSSGGSQSPAGGGATALPAPPTAAPTADFADATPAPTPQAPAAAEAPA